MGHLEEVLEVSEDKFWELHRDNRIWWGEKTVTTCPLSKRFLSEVTEGAGPANTLDVRRSRTYPRSQEGTAVVRWIPKH